MKVYIAAPFFNPQQLAIVQELEAVLESYSIDYFSPRSEGTLSDMSREKQDMTRAGIFQSNIDNMSICTHMIACVQFKDTGTIFEQGFMYAQGKPIIMMSNDLSVVNVMLAESAHGIARSADHAAQLILGLDISAEIGEYT